MTKSVKIVDNSPHVTDRQIEVTEPGFNPPQTRRVPIGGEVEFSLHGDNSLEVREVNLAAEAAQDPDPEPSSEPATGGESTAA